ncbi:DUF2243 domain-containing protein [Planococcus dechangensis]|uniref:DUF2243 domain-containing protein n=1 Tax=Planococcus dechangensis TaxID=1176255 RepID=A0ABV9M9Z2_9BACL
MKLEKRNMWSGLLFGIGVIAFVDEVIFHQLLQWHHFYDLSTPQVGIFADGLLNSFAWFAAIGGLFLFADLRRRNALWTQRWIAAIFMGAGGFQLFDGIIDHKVLRTHQIRYNVDLLPYDVAWNVFGALLLILGLVLFRKSRMKQRRS